MAPSTRKQSKPSLHSKAKVAARKSAKKNHKFNGTLSRGQAREVRAALDAETQNIYTVNDTKPPMSSVPVDSIHRLADIMRGL